VLFRLRGIGGHIRLAPENQATHLKTWRFWRLIITDLRDRAIPSAARNAYFQTAPKGGNVAPKDLVIVMMYEVFV
jgi:hypothetical protein